MEGEKEEGWGGGRREVVSKAVGVEEGKEEEGEGGLQDKYSESSEMG